MPIGHYNVIIIENTNSLKKNSVECIYCIICFIMNKCVTMVGTRFLTQFLLQLNIALRDNCSDGNVYILCVMKRIELLYLESPQK